MHDLITGLPQQLAQSDCSRARGIKSWPFGRPFVRHHSNPRTEANQLLSGKGNESAQGSAKIGSHRPLQPCLHQCRLVSPRLASYRFGALQILHTAHRTNLICVVYHSARGVPSLIFCTRSGFVTNARPKAISTSLSLYCVFTAVAADSGLKPPARTIGP